MNIFDLVENKEDLPSVNQQMANYYYREVQALRDIQDTAAQAKFPGSSIDFRWNMDTRNWWIPNKSYFKLKLKITGMDDLPLREGDDISLNMNTCANLFQKMHVKMNGKTIDSIDENLAECDTILNRITKSKTILNTGSLNDCNSMNPYHDVRKQEICSDGKLYEYKLDDSAESSEYLVFSKTDLGYGGAFISIDADNLLTFSAGPNTNEVFQIGDIIVLQLYAGAVQEAFQRVFIVLSVDANQTMGLSNNGTAQGAIGNPAAGDAGLILYRFQSPVVYYPKLALTAAANTTIALAANGTMTFGAATKPALVTQGDVLITPLVNGGTRYASHFVNYPVPSIFNDVLTTIQYRTADASTAKVAADDELIIYKYSDKYIFKDFKELYPVDTTFSIALNGIVTFTSAAGRLPLVQDVWKVGDWFVYDIVAGRRQAFVASIDSENQTITVIGSIQQAAVAANAANEPLFRYRYDAGNSSFKNNSINVAKQKGTTELTWYPACSAIFGYNRAIPGACKFEIELTPQPTNIYREKAIESKYGVPKYSGTHFQLYIEDIKLYILQCESKAVDKAEYFISTEAIKCHKVTLNSKNLTQTTIDVTPSCYALALAFQDGQNGNTSDKSNSKFHIGNKEELGIKRYSIRYAGMSVPQPDAELNYDGDQNLLLNSYFKNNIYTSQQYQASSESFKDWIERGIYFYHPFIKSADNTETRAYILTDFQSSEASNIKLLLFEFYQKLTLVRMKNGTVYDLRTANN